MLLQKNITYNQPSKRLYTVIDLHFENEQSLTRFARFPVLESVQDTYLSKTVIIYRKSYTTENDLKDS